MLKLHWRSAFTSNLLHTTVWTALLACSWSETLSEAQVVCGNRHPTLCSTRCTSTTLTCIMTSAYATICCRPLLPVIDSCCDTYLRNGGTGNFAYLTI